MAGGLLGIIIMTIIPIWGLILAPGTARFFFAAAVLCRFSIFTYNIKWMNTSPAAFPWALLTPYLTVYIVIKAVWTTLKNKGIDWRGTHYPLHELKKEAPLITFFS